MMPETFSRSKRMKVTFDYLPEFERGAKALRKKYPSFESDFMHKKRTKIENLGNFSLKILGIFISLRHE